MGHGARAGGLAGGVLHGMTVPPSDSAPWDTALAPAALPVACCTGWASRPPVPLRGRARSAPGVPSSASGVSSSASGVSSSGRGRSPRGVASDVRSPRTPNPLP